VKVQFKSGKGVAVQIAVVAMMLAMSVPSWAQSQISREGNAWVETQSGTLQSGRTLRVSADVGSISIETGGQGFRYVVRKRSYSSEQEARRQFDVFHVSTSKEGDTTTLRVTNGGGRIHGRFSTEIVVTVPRELDLIKVSTDAGNVSVQPTTAKLYVSTEGGNVSLSDSGELKSQTMGGDTKIRNVYGDASIQSGGGNISIGTVKGKLVLNSDGGNIDVNTVGLAKIETGAGCVTLWHSNGDADVRTGGGTIALGDINGSTRAETGGGNIRVGMSKGTVIASTGGGNIELWKLYRNAQVQTGAGAITAEFLGGKGGFGESYLHTSAGDVVVYLSTAFSGSVRASSEMASGSGIRSDFPELRITSEGGDYGPKTMFAEGSLNGGGPLLKVRTTIGQIAFRRSDK
jgi:DUF4097 and DUF4098 domain-containing protein YvlB